MHKSQVAITMVIFTLSLSPIISIAKNNTTAASSQSAQQKQLAATHKSSQKKPPNNSNLTPNNKENNEWTLIDVLTIATSLLTLAIALAGITIPGYIKRTKEHDDRIAAQEKAVQEMRKQLSQMPSGNILWYAEMLRQEFWGQHLNKLSDKKKAVNAEQLRHIISELNKDIEALSELLNIGYTAAVSTGLNTLDRRKMKPPRILARLLRILKQEGMLDPAEHWDIAEKIAARLDTSIKDVEVNASKVD